MDDERPRVAPIPPSRQLLRYVCVCACVHCRLALALPGPSAQELGQGSETQQVRKEMREKQLRAQVKAKVGVMNNVELTSALH